MNGFQAEVIEDTSSGPFTHSRLVTFQLRYPRLIHSEFMTHRVFSRNASSSRAIPVAKVIKQVREEPAMPVHWGKNQSGMQAREELTGFELEDAKTAWLRAAKDAADHAEHMMGLGLHKQVANRILEPFQFISVVVTSSEWDNFFALRCHPDADPNIQQLANMMKAAYDASQPGSIEDNFGWHLPYIKQAEIGLMSLEKRVKCSVARCARVSYLTHDGETPDVAKDLELYDRLVKATPAHLSPTEHQAHRGITEVNGLPMNGNFNFRWTQFRKCLEAGEPEAFWEL